MNATVTLPISELDTLRDDIRESKAKLAELQAKEKQIKIVVSQNVTGYNYSGYSSWATAAPILQEYNQIISTTYHGLEEIQDVLLRESKSIVQNTINSLENKLKYQSEDHKKQIERREQETKEIILKKDKEIAKLMKEEVDKTKDEEIKALKIEIASLKSDYRVAAEQVKFLMKRNWFQRLFNL